VAAVTSEQKRGKQRRGLKKALKQKVAHLKRR
jgi:hypothetical protein